MSNVSVAVNLLAPLLLINSVSSLEDITEDEVGNDEDFLEYDFGTDEDGNSNMTIIIIAVVIVVGIITAAAIYIRHVKKQAALRVNQPVQKKDDPENPLGLSKVPIDVVQGKKGEIRYAGLGIAGWRDYMEDRHVAQLNITAGVHFFAVFDGHGGFEVSQYCKEHFVETLKSNENFKLKNYKEALEETYLKMDNLLDSPEGKAELGAKCEKHPNKKEEASDAGATATMVIITPDKIYCANAGDSRTVLVRRGAAKFETVPLSVDHKPSDEVEKARIQKAGGFVRMGRIMNILACARSIGDLSFKFNEELGQKDQMVTCFPDVTVTERSKEDLYILLACDGLWDVYSSEEAVEQLVNRVYKKPPKNAAAFLKGVEELVDSCWTRDDNEDGKTNDNITALLVEFN